MTIIYFVTILASVLVGDAIIHARILKTAIFKYIPAIKMHHVVIITNVPKTPQETYAIDFGYEGRMKKSRLLLVLGQNIPSEIRIRKLSTHHNSIDIDGALVHEWIQMTEDEKISKHTTDETFANIQNTEIKQFIERFKNWNDGKMNLYSANCQHFSWAILHNKPMI